MRKLLFITYCVLHLFGSNLLAQSDSDTLLAKDNAMIPLPTVSVNVGFNHGFTDVALGKDGPTPFRQLGYQLTVVQRTAKFLNVGFELYSGTVYGEEQRGLVNVNYRTSLVSPRITFEYNFYPLLKPDSRGRQLIRPYIGFGVGAVFFRSKGDLKNKNGVAYQYWSDGLMYAESEGSIDASEATQLERDFEYETELRDANLDGFRKYSQTAFSMPINAGIRFQISKNVGINAAFSYVLNVTDMIDNVSSESVGVRQGETDFDNHLFGSIGLSVFLGTTKPSAKPKLRFEEQIAESNKIEKPETKVVLKEENQKWDDLAAISQQLIEASESMKKIAESSEKNLKDQSEQLTSIADRKLKSNKDIKTAKRESIELIENSIAVLSETTIELNETSNKVNTVSSDLVSKKIDGKFSGAEKIRATVEETIPAMELLKAKIASAKSSEELRSILNITSKNLTHTKDIFSEESKDISESIVTSRKTVVEARTEQLLEVDVSSKAQIDAIENELQELLSQGVLSETEYNEFKTILEESESQLPIEESDGSNLNSEQELESASQLLKNAMVALNNTSNQTEQSLSERRSELGSVAERSIDSKKELKEAKYEALRILEKILTDLTEAENSVSQATSDLNKADESIAELDVANELISTSKIKTSINNTVSLLEASKSKLKSAKNAEELKSVVRLSSTTLGKTRDIISKESVVAATTIDQIRKNLIVDEIELATKSETTEPEKENTQLNTIGKETLHNQLDKLLSDGLIDQEEYQEMKQSINETASAEIVEERVEPFSEKESTTYNEPILVKSDDSATQSSETKGEPSNATNSGFDIESIESSKPKETGDYHWADLNQNEWISPDEVLHFIDLLFEGESARSVGDIQNLIDYYFDQE